MLRQVTSEETFARNICFDTSKQVLDELCYWQSQFSSMFSRKR